MPTGAPRRTFPARWPMLRARPHLRAQRARARAGGAAAPAVVAPVGPRAAGRGDQRCEARRRAGSRATAFALLENGEAFFPRRVRRHRAARSARCCSRPSSCSRTRSASRCTTRCWRAARARRAGRHAGRRLRLARPVSAASSTRSPPPACACACSTRSRRCSACALNVFRRMHRKIVVVDGERAFVGGINYSADHLVDFGPEAKQDYAVEVRGPAGRRDPPLRAARRSAEPRTAAALVRAPQPSGAGPRAARGRRGARRCSSRATTTATATTSSATTASPSARRASASSSPTPTSSPATGCCASCAARRGAASRCSLILQGEPDMPIVKTARELLYDHLQRAGVQDLRVLRAPAARQGGAGRRRVGDGRLEQPRPAEPVAQPRGQRDHPRPRLQPAAARAPRTTLMRERAAREVDADSRGRPRAGGRACAASWSSTSCAASRPGPAGCRPTRRRCVVHAGRCRERRARPSDRTAHEHGARAHATPRPPAAAHAAPLVAAAQARRHARLLRAGRLAARHAGARGRVGRGDAAPCAPTGPGAARRRGAGRRQPRAATAAST